MGPQLFGAGRTTLAAMYCVLAVVSAGLGGMGAWQESAPSTHAERLAEFAFNAIRGAGDQVLDSGLGLQDAEIMELTSYRTQVMRHTARRPDAPLQPPPPPPPPPSPLPPSARHPPAAPPFLLLGVGLVLEVPWLLTRRRSWREPTTSSSSRSRAAPPMDRPGGRRHRGLLRHLRCQRGRPAR